MIDMFALLLVHGLLFIALYQLMMDDRVDQEEPDATPGAGDDGKPAQ